MLLIIILKVSSVENISPQVIGREVIEYMFGSVPTACRRAHEEIVPFARNNR
jgi:hypothetical protein